MTTNGKGSIPRRSLVQRTRADDNWDRIFAGKVKTNKELPPPKRAAKSSSQSNNFTK